ncbi:MAG: DNA internalization-related competence protein ComEC/Rec2 [Acidobacteria bacterium 13_1_40CM_2_60_7]|nr:MAG: DNA internalization-related competence protein ComEC/Rec2 [Acidobacteria bacterium 13_1_40CM_2_60_7]
MKLPAVAIATAFACGILLGYLSFTSSLLATPFWFRGLFLLSLFILLIGVEFVRRERLQAALASAVCAWILLGALAVRIADRPLPADHVLAFIQKGELELKTPLRWRGRLRDEPRRLPWGYAVDIDLAQVNYQGKALSTRGGMRLGYEPTIPAAALADFHAGDEVAFTAQARLPAVFRDDGAFDRRDYLAQQGIHLVAPLRAAELTERLKPAPKTLRVWIARSRAHLRMELDGMLAGAPDAAGVLRAMLLGDRSFVDREESKSFQATGTFHVLVIAGLHVSALAFFLHFAARALRLSRGLTSLFILALLIGYVAVVEVRPPVVRATLMAAVVVLGRAMFRRLDLLNSAGMAALVILLVRPLELFDASFQLSFLAMGCIGGLAAPWLENTIEPYARALRGWRDVTRDAANEPRPTQFRIDLRALDRWLASRLPGILGARAGGGLAALTAFGFRVWEIFVLSLVLQAGMLPMMAKQFHRITLSGPVANLVAVPITGILVPLGFLTLGAGLAYQRLGALLGVPLAWLTHLLMRMVLWLAHFSGWSYRIPGPPWWTVAWFFAALVALAVLLRLGKRQATRVALVCLALAAGVIASYPFAPRLTVGALEVTALDVGQGDSILVILPRGKTMLIDGGGAFAGFRGEENYAGPDPGEDAVSPYLWSRGIRRLDVVALTHAHHDHLGGLIAIVENFRVGSLWIGREVAAPAFARLEQLATERHIPIVHEASGASFDRDGVHGDVLWPHTAGKEPAGPPKNDDSLVLRLVYGKRAILLPGDAEKDAEQEIVAETPGDALRADVLKVGHHGSRNSTTPEFLARVHPSLALISSGADNPYGHPSPELLERLALAGVRILRTDQNGAIHVVTDGESLQVSCYVACLVAPRADASTGAQRADQEQKRQN